MAETGHFRGEGGSVWEMDLPLGETMQDRLDRGYLTRVNPDGTDWTNPGAAPGEPSSEPESLPKQTDPKAKWVGYAVRVGGMTPDDADAMTKTDLIEKFGGR